MSDVGVKLDTSNNQPDNLTIYDRETCIGKFHGIGLPTLTDAERNKIYKKYSDCYADSEDKLHAKTRYLIGENAGEEKSGQLYGGRLGNQNGYESRGKEWYNHKAGWVNIFRPKDPRLADAIATIMEEIIANPYIGYDNSGSRRYSLYFQWLNNGCSIKNINKPCCSDCSGTTYVVLQEALLRTYGYECRSTSLIKSGDTGKTRTFTNADGKQTYSVTQQQNYVDIGNPLKYIDNYEKYTEDKANNNKENELLKNYNYILNYFGTLNLTDAKVQSNTLPLGITSYNTRYNDFKINYQVNRFFQSKPTQNYLYDMDKTVEDGGLLRGMAAPYGSNFHWFCEYDLKDFFTVFFDHTYDFPDLISQTTKDDGTTTTNTTKYLYTVTDSITVRPMSPLNTYTNNKLFLKDSAGVAKSDVLSKGGLTSMFFNGSWIDGNKNSIEAMNLWCPITFNEYDYESYTEPNESTENYKNIIFKHKLYEDFKNWMFIKRFGLSSAGIADKDYYMSGTSSNKWTLYKKGDTDTTIEVPCDLMTARHITPNILRRGDLILTRTDLGHNQDSYVMTMTTTNDVKTYSEQQIFTEAPNGGHIAIWL